MERGTLLSQEPRVGRKVFTTIGFPDFALSISIIFFCLLPRYRFGFRNGFFMPVGFVNAACNPLLQQTSPTPWTPIPLPHPSGYRQRLSPYR